ncbi:MAG TPA: hypothetical protein ACFYD6_07645 [Candidatus Brocadiia bacterium]|nr:hypothetical protein [Candidatus Brocadiales bacterium]
MDIDSTEWIALKEAEQIIGRSRRQIWRYIYDGSWDTRAVIDNMNRQVTYVKMSDILKKKAELESASITDKGKGNTDAKGENAEADLTIVQQLMERLTAGQECQNDLLKKCLYIMEGINFRSIKVFIFIILICVIAMAVCSIVKIIID